MLNCVFFTWRLDAIVTTCVAVATYLPPAHCACYWKNHLKMYTVDINCETCTVALRILLPYMAIKRVTYYCAG